MTEVYCKDCANSTRVTEQLCNPTLGCKLTESTETDVVTGNVRRYYVACRNARMVGGICEGGKLFKPKDKPWWRFWQ